MAGRLKAAIAAVVFLLAAYLASLCASCVSVPQAADFTGGESIYGEVTSISDASFEMEVAGEMLTVMSDDSLTLRYLEVGRPVTVAYFPEDREGNVIHAYSVHEAILDFTTGEYVATP